VFIIRSPIIKTNRPITKFLNSVIFKTARGEDVFNTKIVSEVVKITIVYGLWFMVFCWGIEVFIVYGFLFFVGLVRIEELFPIR